MLRGPPIPCPPARGTPTKIEQPGPNAHCNTHNSSLTPLKAYYTFPMTIEFGPIELVKISSDNASKKPQAELRQVVTTRYPSMRVGSSTSDSFFTEEEMGVETKNYDSIRYFWMKVTNIVTPEMLEEKFIKFPKARIMRSLFSTPQISIEHKQAIAAELTTEEEIIESQLVVYGPNSKKKGEEPGTPILHLGAKQYRTYDLKMSPVADVDQRVAPSELEG